MRRSTSPTSSASLARNPLVKIAGGVVILIVAAALGIPLTTGRNNQHSTNRERTIEDRNITDQPASTTASPDLDALLALIDSETSGEMVRVTATVHRLLSDDNDGSRHQRFLISIDPGSSRPRTVKVSHNIDLAPRVPVAQGDLVTVLGQFEFNELGGAIHWTHHDPDNRRRGGWIEHNSKRYE